MPKYSLTPLIDKAILAAHLSQHKSQKWLMNHSRTIIEFAYQEASFREITY
jgi:hypothetical protein